MISYNAVPIKDQFFVLFINLIVIIVVDYDVILGIDYLLTYHAILDC